MFYSRMKEYPIQKKSTVDDGFGFKKEQYADAGTVKAYIIRTDLTKYTANELDLTQYQFTGYTMDSGLSIGDKVDGKRITEITPHRQGFYMYLTSLGGE